MCTEHLHHLETLPAPTITRVRLVPITQTRRWTRRHALVNAGFAGAGIAILSACGGGSSSRPSSSATSPDPTSTIGANDSPTTASTSEAEPAVPAEELTELQLQHVSLGFVSAYVLVRGSEAAIVDTGTAGSGAAITEALTQLGLAPLDVGHIILTHNHGDHAGGLGELASEMTNATVYAGPGDIDTIETSLRLRQLSDGDEVFGLGVVGTPGHTVGSISVFDTETGLVVAGDAINGDGAGGLTGANPSFTDDMATADASVAKLAALTPRVAAFGHGGPPVTVDVATKLAALV